MPTERCCGAPTSEVGQRPGVGLLPRRDRGGVAKPRGLLPLADATDRLEGNAAHVYADFDATDAPSRSRRSARGAGNWNYAAPRSPRPPATARRPGASGTTSSTARGPGHPAGGDAGLLPRQHVRGAPRGAADRLHRGRRQLPGENPPRGKAGDAIQAEPLDSAALVAGRPVPGDQQRQREHVHAARRRAAADADVPVRAGRGAAALDYPFSDVHGGDDASVIYHEYTHGLSNRLVIDLTATARWTPSRPARWARPGATSTPWTSSCPGVPRGQPRPGELKVGEFVDSGQSLVRTEPIDCRPRRPGRRRARAGACRRVEGSGGYTYAHFGKILGGARGPRRRRDLGADADRPAPPPRRRARRPTGHARPRR